MAQAYEGRGLSPETLRVVRWPARLWFHPGTQIQQLGALCALCGRVRWVVVKQLLAQGTLWFGGCSRAATGISHIGLTRYAFVAVCVGPLCAEQARGVAAQDWSTCSTLG